MQPSPARITPPLLLQAWTTSPLGALLPRLQRGLQRSGSFLYHRRAPSIRTVSLSLELHRHAIDETYAAFIASGLELRRDAHTALASLCVPDTRPLRRGSSRLIAIQLEIRSLHQLDGALLPPTLAISA